MSYAQQYLKASFDYGSIAKSHNLRAINPQGTCFAITCDWLWVLVSDSQTATAGPLMDFLSGETPRLAPFHADHTRRVDGAKGADKRMAEYERSFDRFNLAVTNIDRNSDAVVGASRLPPFSGANWMSCTPGDMWCVIGKYLRQEVKGGALLNLYDGKVKSASKEGHAIGAFVQQDEAVRVFDMNAGEFLLKDQNAWVAWAKALDTYYAPTVYNFVDVYEVVHR